MLAKIIVGALFLVFVAAVFASEDAPEVTIDQGVLRGKYQKSRLGKTFSAFTAIPYAKPPVGELRFKVAVPAEPWEGVLDATKPHPVCPQINIFTSTKSNTVIGEEDCLYLNVYTPQLPDSEQKLLPVMFYIHGGGWFSGSANFHGPDLLLDKNVVLVTANYRLGPLGFLTSGDLKALGNNGLKDQYLAIKWTKDNIAKFGGDPESITVFGQSAGGASAHYHMLSPLTKNLIKGVIAQSGTALAHFAVMPHFLNTRRSKILAGNMGCPTYYTHEMMECLGDADAHKIIEQAALLAEWDMDPIIPFKPVIEFDLPGAFLTQDPIDIIISGKAADIPLMTGLTTDEGYLRAANLYGNLTLVQDLNENFAEIAPLLLLYGESIAVKYRKIVPGEIRKFYFGDKTIDESTKAEFSKMYGDAIIFAGEDVAVELQAKYSKKPVFYYLFGYKGSSSFCSLFSGDLSADHGACHCDELFYLFSNDGFFPDYKLTESDEKVIDFMTTLWTNFAKYGNPTPETDSAVSVKWEPVQRGQQNYYFIKSESDVQVSQDVFPERAMFWRNLKLNVRTDKIRDEL